MTKSKEDFFTEKVVENIWNGCKKYDLKSGTYVSFYDLTDFLKKEYGFKDSVKCERGYLKNGVVPKKYLKELLTAAARLGQVSENPDKYWRSPIAERNCYWDNPGMGSPCPLICEDDIKEHPEYMALLLESVYGDSTQTELRDSLIVMIEQAYATSDYARQHVTKRIEEIAKYLNKSKIPANLSENSLKVAGRVYMPCAMEVQTSEEKIAELEEKLKHVNSREKKSQKAAESITNRIKEIQDGSFRPDYYPAVKMASLMDQKHSDE